MSDEWKPIETAPKTLAAQEFILVAFPGRYVAAGKWSAFDKAWWDMMTVGDFGIDCLDPQPTHWMPLPAPPPSG